MNRGAPELPPFSARLHALFAAYLRRYFARHFNAVRISRLGAPPPATPGAPLVIYSNHPGWWDPMLYILLHRLLFRGREGYGPMDAAALQRYAFLRRLGAFGVEQGTWRGGAQFLRTASAVLERGALLWMTAEGAFTDARDRPLRLQPGLAHLVARAGPVRLVPLAIEYPFWNERAPEALVCFGRAFEIGGRRGHEEVQACHQRLQHSLEHTMDALAARARARDPAAFNILVDGRKGVGGLYDLGRRLKAWLRGRRFDSSQTQSGDPHR